MGFFEGLMKVVGFVLETGAKGIDRMSDEQLEEMSIDRFARTGNIEDLNKTADQHRAFAAQAHEAAQEAHERANGNKDNDDD